MGISIQVDGSGSFSNTVRRLRRLSGNDLYVILSKYGPLGVLALSSATPVNTGETAHSWIYEIVKRRGSYEIIWKNTNVVDGANIALLIQYGHGTGTGGYVQGRDYINPAMDPIFKAIRDDIRKVVRA